MPFLKALAFWGQSHTYGGGGLFVDNTRFWLNGQDETRDDVTEGTSQVAQPAPPWPWGMSDHDIYYARLKRDGWRLQGEITHPDSIATWEKKRNAWTLRQFSRYGENPNGRGSFWQWFQAHDSLSGETLGDPSWEWADFDGQRLVWAQHGKLLTTQIWDGGHSDIIELADFTQWQFKNIIAPY